MASHLWRAAIYLNNTGVALLDKGCFKQAAQAFTDSVWIVKEISANHVAKSSEQEKFCPSSVEKKLSEAANRLLRAISSSGKKISFKIEILNGEEHLLERMASLTGGSSDDTKVYAVHIAQIPVEIPSTKSIAVESSIILYNQGIAYLCLSSISSIPALFQEMMSEGALRLFELAHCTLSNSGQQEGSIALMFLDFLSLSSLIQVENHCRRTTNYNHYTRRLDTVRMSIQLKIAEGKVDCTRSASAA